MGESRVELALVEHAEELRGSLGRMAPPRLLRFETVEDLYQGFASEALRRADRFQDRGEGSARSWLHEVARNYLRDRQRHWAALKRGSGRILRSGFGVPATDGGEDVARDKAASQSGPDSIAARREQLLLVAKALALLLPRDRSIVEWTSEGQSLAEIAERLDMSPDAVGRARARALERLRKTHELVAKSSSPDS